MILNLQTGRSCWDVVKHYDSDDLLSGSEDEKALGRARRLAAAELKKTGAIWPQPKRINPLIHWPPKFPRVHHNPDRTVRGPNAVNRPEWRLRPDHGAEVLTDVNFSDISTGWSKTWEKVPDDLELIWPDWLKIQLIYIYFLPNLVFWNAFFTEC